MAKPDKHVSVDTPEAVEVVQQLVRTAYSAGKVEGVRESGERMLEIYDSAMAREHGPDLNRER